MAKLLVWFMTTLYVLKISSSRDGTITKLTENNQIFSDYAYAKVYRSNKHGRPVYTTFMLSESVREKFSPVSRSTSRLETRSKVSTRSSTRLR